MADVQIRPSEKKPGKFEVTAYRHDDPETGFWKWWRGWDNEAWSKRGFVWIRSRPSSLARAERLRRKWTEQIDRELAAYEQAAEALRD